MTIEIYPDSQRARFFDPLDTLREDEDRAAQMVAATPILDEPALYIQFSDCGQHIRKWSRDHFQGATEFILA